MTEDMHNPEVVKQKNKGGCLWGCLIGFLIFLVVVVGGGAAVYFAGRAYITKRLPVWEERYPILSIVGDIIGIKEEVNSLGKEFQGSDKRQEGVNDKSLVARDIPLYSQPLAETYSITEGQGAGFQRLADSPDEVIKHLRSTMPEKGWVLKSEQEIVGAYLLVWQKDKLICQTEVMEYKDTTEVWLRYSTVSSDLSLDMLELP